MEIHGLHTVTFSIVFWTATARLPGRGDAYDSRSLSVCAYAHTPQETKERLN